MSFPKTTTNSDITMILKRFKNCFRVLFEEKVEPVNFEWFIRDIFIGLTGGVQKEVLFFY